MRRLSVSILSIFFLVIGLNLAEEIQAAQPYPAKPILFIVPIEAGSDGDILTRPLVAKASAVLGKPIMVDNKPGAGPGISPGVNLNVNAGILM